MQLQRLIRIPDPQRMGLIALAIVATCAVAASGLVYPSAYSPLIVAAGIAAVVIGVAWLRKPTWALYAAVLVVFLPSGLIAADLQSMLNRSLAVIALCTWLLAVLVRHDRITVTAPAWLLLGFVVWSACTLFWTTNLSMGTTILQTYVLRLIVYLILIANEITTAKRLEGLLTTMAISGWLLVSISAAIAMLNGYTPGTRFQVLDMNENGTGVLALMAMPGVLWQAMKGDGRQRAGRMLVSWVFVGMAVILAMMTGSRGSAISFAITLGAFWIWKPTCPWGKLGLAFLVVTVLVVPSIFTTIVQRFAIEHGDTMLGGREALWSAAWTLIGDHPWKGVGIGNGPYAMMPQVGAVIGIGQYSFAAIHNPVLTIWAETGLPGLILYLGTLGSAIWLFLGQYLQHSKADTHWLMPYYALVAASFLGYMASWIKGGGMETDYSYFLMVALLVIPSCLRSEVLSSGTAIASSERQII